MKMKSMTMELYFLRKKIIMNNQFLLIQRDKLNTIEYKVRSPVVLFIFNRPDLTRIVFEEIKRVQPTKLYIISDGPRVNIEGEGDLVNESRKIVHDIDWSCDVTTLFSDVNLGCKARISSGIALVFDQEADAIFLEDDCFPGSGFFRYCDELLETYRDYKSILMINGTSMFSRDLLRNKESYYFTRYPRIWGWASWRDKWLHHYDLDMKSWPIMKDQVIETILNKRERKFWDRTFEDTYVGKIDTWDYQVAYTMMLNKMLAISPSFNLVSNIGCGHVSSTHTGRYNEFAELALEQIEFPLMHPDSVTANEYIDEIFSKKQFRIFTIPERLIRRLLFLFK